MLENFPIQEMISFHRPFFIYDEERINSNIQTVSKVMQEMLGTPVSLSFSLKSQPNFKIIDTLRKKGLSIDVSSYNELSYTQDLQFSSETIFLGGVGITVHALEAAFSKKIGAIHANSIDLYKTMEELKKINNCSTALTIRFHPQYLKGNKIGEGFDRLVEIFRGKKSLSGLHVYIGRESFEEAIVKKVFEDISELARLGLFQDDWTLYFGPGLPDLDQVKLDLFSIKNPAPKTKIEVGRSLVSSCGFYGAPVLSVKQFGGLKKTVIVDGGFQHFGSPWVSLKQGPLAIKGLFFDEYGNKKDSSANVASIYGSLCLWHDCLHPSFPIPNDLKRGDWIVVPNMGAYGLTAGVPLFIGETLPLEFYFDGKVLHNVTHHKFGESAEE